MGEPFQRAPRERVIHTSQDMGDALAETFLTNAVTGDDTANTDLVGRLLAWQRRRQGRPS